MSPRILRLPLKGGENTVPHPADLRSSIEVRSATRLSELRAEGERLFAGNPGTELRCIGIPRAVTVIARALVAV